MQKRTYTKRQPTEKMQRVYVPITPATLSKFYNETGLKPGYDEKGKLDAETQKAVISWLLGHIQTNLF